MKYITCLIIEASKLDPGASTATEIETAMDQMKAGGLSKRRSSAPPSLPALVPDALLLSMDGPPPTRNLVETKFKLPRELACLINNSPRSRRRSKSHIPVQDCANNDSSSEMPKAAGDLIQELHVGSVKGEEKHHHQEGQLEQEEEDVDVSGSDQDDKADADEERRRYPARQRRSWVPVPLFTSHLIKESPRKRHKSMRGHKDPRSARKHDNSRHISGYEHDTHKGAEHSRQRKGTHFSSDHHQRPRNQIPALRSRDERRQEWEAAAAVDYNLRKRKELDYAEEDSYSDELDSSEELDHPLRYRRGHDNLQYVVNNQKVIAASRGRAAGQQHQNDKAAGARQASNRVPAGVTDEGKYLVVGSYEKGKPRRLTRSTDSQHINGGHSIDTQQDVKKDKMKVENPEFSSSSDSSSSGTSSEDDRSEGEPDEQMRKLAEVRNKDELQAGGESGQVTYRESSSEGCEDDDEHLEEEEEQRQQAAWNRERLRPRQPPPGSKPATNKQSNVRPTGHAASRPHSVSHRHHQSSRLRGGGGGGLSRPPRNADVRRGGRRGSTTVRWLHEEDELPAHQDPSAAWRGISMGALGAPGGGGVFPTSPGVAALIASLGGVPGGTIGGGNQLLPGTGSAARHHPGLPGSAAWDGLLAGGASVDPAAAGLFSRGGGGTKPPATAVVNAEITPVQVDASVSFDQVGGLDHFVSALKEMVFLPLVYPELFERFRVQPPRGVLFYGPPGTGKTLVARALAAHASKFGQPVAFFMRKGADILSKWVGEAERQLRLLFEEAQKHQPSIIFFDEIDGLAPVRSSKQVRR
ncbi:hypothetical protein CEUSTIGMA_g13934.t1 [Chlamydomonas eustigma]|uniref:ATPase AAA-type core domain-containing protein n=1 Tax=Chlamydomonas eustigma TaxID=1157962 RepID=A0A250XTY6_9CHLO|nr:hypothetical protein CEUSTIGMA_g13934.t1 [Chlamydomonas eustigma]|eukprot:GAX86527.1 hypothetical protein CEUSTIGMA_g13934.t1 [Chlamydomonas eustigma]